MRGCQREMGDTGNGEEEDAGKEERLAPLPLSHWAWSLQAPAGEAGGGDTSQNQAPK